MTDRQILIAYSMQKRHGKACLGRQIGREDPKLVLSTDRQADRQMDNSLYLQCGAKFSKLGTR